MIDLACLLGLMLWAQPSDSLGSIGGHASGHGVVGARHVLVSTSDAGVYVIDVEDPASLQLVHTIAIDGVPREIAASGDLAVVTTAGKLHVIDVSQPAKARVVGAVEYGGRSGLVALDGHIALVRARDALQIFDLSRPSTPEVVGAIDVSASAICLHGGVCAVRSADGIRLFDVSHPASAGQLSFVAGRFGHMSLTVESLLVQEGPRTLIFDVSDPANPRALGAIEESARADPVRSDDLVVLAHDNQMSMYDVSNPARPRLVGTAEMLSQQARWISLAGDRLYLTSAQVPLQVMDVSDSEPKLKGVFDTPSSTTFLTHDDGVVLLSERVRGTRAGALHRVDVSDPANPSMLGTAFLEPGMIPRAIEGDLVFVSQSLDDSSVTFTSVDMSAPPAMRVLDSLEGFGARIVAARIIDGVCFATYQAFSDDDGLVCIDVSDPANLAVIGRLVEPYAIGRFDIDGGIACTVNGSVVVTMDVSDPASPSLVAKAKVSNRVCGDVRLRDRTAFVAAGRLDIVARRDAPRDAPQGALLVVDVTGEPTLVTSVELSQPLFTLELVGDLLFAAGKKTLYVFDVSMPESPRVVGQFVTGIDGIDLEIDASYAYVAGDDPGLVIIDVSDCLP